jgi:uncharacterized protein (TIGR00730 family)
MVTSVCVFVGSRPGADAAYAAAVHELGRELGRRRLGVIYGGGRAGLMGVLADAALATGAEVTGVIPQALVDREVAHPALSALEVVGSLHERKAAMAAHADAFIGAPGGIGTLEELIEVLSWRQLGLHDKPCGLLNVNGYFDRLLAWFEHAVGEGFVAAADRRLLTVATAPDDLLDRLGAGQESESS